MEWRAEKCSGEWRLEGCRERSGGLQGKVWGAQPQAFTFNHDDNLARHGGAPPLVLALEWQREAGESL